MSKAQRQQQILDRLYTVGQVYVDKLADLFGTSKDTIRRDLEELERNGILRRVYGGAVPAKTRILSTVQRRHLDREEKYAVAKKAVDLLQPDTLIAIDGGTTNTIFASLIPHSMPLRVVTNSFLVAESLQKHPRVEMFFLGGRYNVESQTTVGETVFSQLENYYFDHCFLGVYAIDAEQGLSSPYPYDDETSVKQYLVKHSAQVTFMAACAKLDRKANYIICGLHDVTHIICKRPVPKETAKRYANKII